MARSLTKEAFERVRSLVLGAAANGIRSPQFEAGGVPSSVYSTLKHRKAGLGG